MDNWGVHLPVNIGRLERSWQPKGDGVGDVALVFCPPRAGLTFYSISVESLIVPSDPEGLAVLVCDYTISVIRESSENRG